MAISWKESLHAVNFVQSSVLNMLSLNRFNWCLQQRLQSTPPKKKKTSPQASLNIFISVLIALIISIFASVSHSPRVEERMVSLCGTSTTVILRYNRSSSIAALVHPVFVFFSPKYCIQKKKKMSNDSEVLYMTIRMIGLSTNDRTSGFFPRADCLRIFCSPALHLPLCLVTLSTL